MGYLELLVSRMSIALYSEIFIFDDVALRQCLDEAAENTTAKLTALYHPSHVEGTIIEESNRMSETQVNNFSFNKPLISEFILS